jgi:transketolase
VNTISQEALLFLSHQALNLRIDSMRATTASQSGHPTSCFSAADIISVIFFHLLRYDIKNPKYSNNDRFILSKGHAIPVVYAAWKNLGVISDELLMTLRRVDSVLEGHPTPRFAYNEAATGSLGQGLSIGLGMALQAKKDHLDFRTYVMMGDGEIAEGSIWEAAELAAHYKLDNLVGIVDCNRLGQSEEVMHDHDAVKYARKFEACDWHSIIINGHDNAEILKAFQQAQQIKDRPTVLIAKTYKGFGLDHVQDKMGFHGKPFKEAELQEALKELIKRFQQAYDYKLALAYVPPMPAKTSTKDVISEPININLVADPQAASFDKDKKLASRQAYGYALAALGRANHSVMVLDADVKNSTYGDIFEKEFPDRFIQCFIAEQNMIGVSIGLELRGKIPFAATFAAFFTRAHDQIRMAAIGRSALRLCGSHVGVSIGEDGPSQMGLEDIALMRAIPDSIVLYPSDGVSTFKLVELMANYHHCISYLRTTRAATPILYDKNETFKIGGCKILRQSDHDKVCIIAAGITLYEALKAHQILQAQDVAVSVIDLYSVKPLDVATIKQVASQSCNKIITVEDHYQEGGLSEAVMHAFAQDKVMIKAMAVTKLSRSGSPEDLLKDAQIDTASIVKAVLAWNL